MATDTLGANSRRREAGTVSIWIARRQGRLGKGVSAGEDDPREGLGWRQLRQRAVAAGSGELTARRASFVGRCRRRSNWVCPPICPPHLPDQAFKKQPKWPGHEAGGLSVSRKLFPWPICESRLGNPAIRTLFPTSRGGASYASNPCSQLGKGRSCRRPIHASR